MTKSTTPAKTSKKASPAKSAPKKRAPKKTSSAKPTAKKTASAETMRAAAIAASWRDKGIAEARSAKHKVKVGGQEYNSVGAAFRELGLDMNKHIKFRKELKASASGQASFEGKRFFLVARADA